jgi:hypothetical protein
MWPAYFPRKKRERRLAYLTDILNEDAEVEGYNIWAEPIEVDPEWRRWEVHSYEELKARIIESGLEVHVFSLFGKNGLVWMLEAVKDPLTKCHLANSSKSVIMLTVKSGTNHHRSGKITVCKSWGWQQSPDRVYLTALRNIYDQFDYGTHPTPGSLGRNSLMWIIGHTTRKKYSRPPQMLRDRLFKYGSGGRADDFHLYEQYDVAYEADFDNHYAEQALWGVPTDGILRFGQRDVWSDDLTQLEEYALAFVQCKITIPEGNVKKFSPFYTREGGQLRWQTEPGTYYGYFFSPVIVACLKNGYTVEIGSGWAWRTLDKFLVPWILEALKLRREFQELGMELEAELTKGFIVATFGGFGMRPYSLELIHKDDKKEEDERYLDLNANPFYGEDPYTEYFIRRVDTPDANHLTQVLYYIICRANLKLFEYCVAEEELGNIVISTNFDAAVTTLPSITRPPGMKHKIHRNYVQDALRSYHSDLGGKHPGKKREA